MLQVYNTLTGKKEEFKPVEEGKVKMYVCGLTVQNYSHIGHTRSAINYDVIRRYLEYRGYDVFYIQNFTDINEKIVDRAHKEGLTPKEVADKYTEAYLEDLDSLHVKEADIYCSATDNINEIIEMTKTLLGKGYAYEVNGNVYFSVEKFDDYGKLSGRNLEEMEAGSRVEINEEKQHPMDFALWKKVEDNVMAWDSPWGEGWPGWHIECSAMSIKYLGTCFDIHGGGTDLIFPHHENEIAQSEAYCSCQSVKYWLHNGTVNIKGEKMSKSLGNFFTTREILQKFSADEIRYFILTKHYHSPIDFSLKEMKSARVSFNKLLNTYHNLNKLLARDEGQENDFAKDSKTGQEFNRISAQFNQKLESRKQQFIKAMDDDFNTARAMGVMHELSTDINSFINNPKFILTDDVFSLIDRAKTLFDEVTGVFGLTMKHKQKDYVHSDKFKQLVSYILELREEARDEEKWEFADKLRDDLQDIGIEIKDTPHGPEWELVEAEEKGVHDDKY